MVSAYSQTQHKQRLGSCTRGHEHTFNLLENGNFTSISKSCPSVLSRPSTSFLAFGINIPDRPAKFGHYLRGKSGVSPPTAPYWIPWIGHAWPFILSLTLLALSVRYDLTISWHAGDLWLY